MGAHALFSPSGFQALMLCPAKPAMERGRPDDANEYADEGTAAHFLGATCLVNGEQAPLYLGRRIAVWKHKQSDLEGTGFAEVIEHHPDKDQLAFRVFTVDTDFAEAVQTYIDTVRARITMYEQLGAIVEMFVEQAVPIGHITGEEGAEGTSDVVLIAVFNGGDGRVLVETIDLKFGRGVEVDAKDNPQLRLYCLGAAEKYGMLYDFTHASMLICQPRVNDTPSEDACTFAELQAWAREKAAPAAQLAQRIYFGQEPMQANCRPQDDACRFCKAKADCQALADKVQTAMGLEFTDLTTADKIEGEAIVETAVTTASAAGDLGARMDAVPLVEMWCKAIRAKVEGVLLAGGAVEGYKLVAGKKGNRAWSDEAEVEKTLKGMRLKKEQMYDFKLISPTSAEKLLKPTPKRWAKAQALITQNDGKPSVAPLADKRPAIEIKPVSAEFTPITDTAPATADDLV